MPSYYRDIFRPVKKLGDDLPDLSIGLDSVRVYQFEVNFEGVPIEGLGTGAHKRMTLAAKQVSPIGVDVDDIEVHRVNEIFFYPGKPKPAEVTITFDDLYSGVSKNLYNWFKQTYDNTNGTINVKKALKVEVVQMDGNMTPVGSTNLYGVYIKSWKESEYNYSTANDFHTIELILRADFTDHSGRNTGTGEDDV